MLIPCTQLNGLGNRGKDESGMTRGATVLEV